MKLVPGNFYFIDNEYGKGNFIYLIKDEHMFDIFVFVSGYKYVSIGYYLNDKDTSKITYFKGSGDVDAWRNNYSLKRNNSNIKIASDKDIYDFFEFLYKNESEYINIILEQIQAYDFKSKFPSHKEIRERKLKFLDNI